MPAPRKRPTENARYALQIIGEQDEYGGAAHVYRFYANAEALSDDVDLCSIHGILFANDGQNILVKVGASDDRSGGPKKIVIHDARLGLNAAIAESEFQVRIEGRNVLFLHSPIVNDVDDRKEPGTRLIALLKEHFSGRDLQIVLDLGTADDDPSFRDYFFPKLEVLGLRFLDHRLALGRWNPMGQNDGTSYYFGAKYE